MNGAARDNSEYAVPAGVLGLKGPVEKPAPGTLPLRGDLAHIALAGTHLAAHYVIPHGHIVGEAGAALRLNPRGDSEAFTTLAAGSRFDRHVHALGEEFLVLEGTFEDEFGAYPFGSYVRNPPGSAHAPSSTSGCVLFVKLRQFHPGDGEHVVVASREAEWFPGVVKGISTLPLHRFGSEFVALVEYAPNTVFPAHAHAGGEEILVLTGVFEDEDGCYPAGTWLRNPPGSRHRPFSLQGCLLYVKVGHLPAVTV
jgi:anti-sigma factor ChrR (cupin superfamily)